MNQSNSPETELKKILTTNKKEITDEITKTYNQLLENLDEETLNMPFIHFQYLLHKNYSPNLYNQDNNCMRKGSFAYQNMINQTYIFKKSNSFIDDFSYLHKKIPIKKENMENNFINLEKEKRQPIKKQQIKTKNIENNLEKKNNQPIKKLQIKKEIIENNLEKKNNQPIKKENVNKEINENNLKTLEIEKNETIKNDTKNNQSNKEEIIVKNKENNQPIKNKENDPLALNRRKTKNKTKLSSVTNEDDLQSNTFNEITESLTINFRNNNYELLQLGNTPRMKEFTKEVRKIIKKYIK